MDTNRELNDILIDDDDLQKQNRTKKLMMMIGMALVFLSVLIAAIFIITREEDELGEKITAVNNGLSPIDESGSEFVNVPLENEQEPDPFQKILDDIRSREPQAQANAQSAQPSQPSQPTPAQPTPAKVAQPKVESKVAQAPAESKKPSAPVLPATPAKPKQVESKPKEAPKATTPAKSEPKKADSTPKQQPATPAPQSVASAFDNVPTSKMDTSRNGQVAEKGYYVQVGSFSNKPNEEFLKKISNYSYRVYGDSKSGLTKYLIGPYKSRIEASRDLPTYKMLVSEPMHFEVK